MMVDSCFHLEPERPARGGRSGQTLVEYTLIFLVVVVVLIIAAASIGEATTESYVETTNTIESVNETVPG